MSTYDLDNRLDLLSKFQFKVTLLAKVGNGLLCHVVVPFLQPQQLFEYGVGVAEHVCCKLLVQRTHLDEGSPTHCALVATWP